MIAKTEWNKLSDDEKYKHYLLALGINDLELERRLKRTEVIKARENRNQEICQLAQAGVRKSVIAKKFGITGTRVSEIISRQEWKNNSIKYENFESSHLVHLGLSVGAYNALMRKGICTIDAAVEIVRNGTPTGIPNLGEVRYSELKERLKVCGYL